MMRKAKGLAAVAGAFVLALFLLGTALAETNTTQTQSGIAQSYQQLFLQRLAAILGIDQPRLETAIRKANEDVINQAEQNGDISKNQADWMRQRLDNGGWPMMWGKGPGHRFGFGRHGHGFGGWMKGWDTSSLDAVASVLGMTADELKTELRDGKTLGEIADTRGVDRQKVIDALVSAKKAKLDEAVANGDLTQKQADNILKRFQSANILDRFGFGCRAW